MCSLEALPLLHSWQFPRLRRECSIALDKYDAINLMVPLGSSSVNVSDDARHNQAQEFAGFTNIYEFVSLRNGISQRRVHRIINVFSLFYLH